MTLGHPACRGSKDSQLAVSSHFIPSVMEAVLGRQDVSVLGCSAEAKGLHGPLHPVWFFVYFCCINGTINKKLSLTRISPLIFFCAVTSTLEGACEFLYKVVCTISETSRELHCWF